MTSFASLAVIRITRNDEAEASDSDDASSVSPGVAVVETVTHVAEDENTSILTVIQETPDMVNVSSAPADHSLLDDEGHYKPQLDWVEWLQGPVIIIALMVVISLILLFLYLYKFRSNMRRQSVINQI